MIWSVTLVSLIQHLLEREGWREKDGEREVGREGVRGVGRDGEGWGRMEREKGGEGEGRGTGRGKEEGKGRRERVSNRTAVTREERLFI